MFRTSNGQPYDTPVKFVIGLSGKCYAVLPNEWEAEDYMKEFGGARLDCLNGFFNGVLLQETLGM